MKLNEYRQIAATASTLLGVLMLAACSDDVLDNTGTRQRMQIVPYGKTYVEGTGSSSRADAPTGYTKFTDFFTTNTDSIVLYISDGEVCDIKGAFTPSDNGSNTWTTPIEASYDTQYYVYGYYPASCSSASISSTDWVNGAKITLPNLQTLSTTDVCVVSGVQSAGNFGYKTPDVGDGEVCKISPLLMDHIYSCIRLDFKVDDEYDKLRTIELKEVKLKFTSGYQYEKVKAEVTLTKDATAPTVTWTGEGSQVSELPTENLVESSPLQLNSSDWTKLREIYTPGVTSEVTFNIISTYDVLDRKGNTVRANCTATNKLTLGKLSNGSWLVAPGKRNVIQLTVKPTYLYQLSEPDLDNPVIKVES